MERLARELRDGGNEVFVISGTFEPRGSVELAEREQDGIRIYTIHRSDLYFDRWEKTYEPRVSRVLLDLLERLRPDVVHGHHFIRLSRNIAHTAALAGIPAVLTLHDFTTTCLIGFRAPGAGASFCDLQPAYSDCVPCAGTVTPSIPLAPESEFQLLRDDFRSELLTARFVCCISNTQRALLAKYHQLPEAHFSVVPLALVAELPRGTEAGSGPLRVASWGIQMERKGAHVLIEAVRRLPRGTVEAEIFGRFDDAGYESRCRAAAKDHSIQFRGRFEWSELASTPLHASVFPSLTFETFGLTLDESRALGHPVIATDLGAYRERADRSTLLFPAGDADALAAHLARLASDRGALAQLRAAVAPPERFGAYVARMRSLYAEAVAQGPPDPAAGGFDPQRHPSETEFAAREAEFVRRLSGGPTQ